MHLQNNNTILFTNSLIVDEYWIMVIDMIIEVILAIMRGLIRHQDGLKGPLITSTDNTGRSHEPAQLLSLVISMLQTSSLN